jgi:GntR family transcriptional regulator/MocR family aminotransferase
VIEDDYDSEFRFDGPPLSSLHGLHPDRVVYIGTFSKTLCPAIRIGYLVLPPLLINLGRSRKWQSDLHNEVVSQMALAHFIDRGHYLRHVRRMRRHYWEKRKAVVRALREICGDRVAILGSAAGLHLVATFAGYRFTPAFFQETEAKGARFYPVAIHAAHPEAHQDKLLLGYGNLGFKEIAQGTALLGSSVDRYRLRPGVRMTDTT